MTMLYVNERVFVIIVIVILLIMLSDLVLVWENEHLTLILYMLFHSVCDAEGLIKFNVSGICVYCRCQQ